MDRARASVERTDALDGRLAEGDDGLRSLDLDSSEALAKVLETALWEEQEAAVSRDSRNQAASEEATHLEVQLAGGEDNVLSSLLDERLDARVGLVEEAQTLDELRQVGRRKRLKGDADDGCGL